MKFTGRENGEYATLTTERETESKKMKINKNIAQKRKVASD